MRNKLKNISNHYKTILYRWIEFYKLYKKSNGKASFFQTIKYFKKWRLSFSLGKSPLVDKQPWIVFEAFQFLGKIIRPDMKVFEFGSGGSSIYFSSKVHTVHSIEHDQSWLEITKTEIEKSHLTNWKGSWIPPQKIEGDIKRDFLVPTNYISILEQYNGYEFYNYASIIEQYPDGFFDLIFIDGRARISCFWHAKEKIKKGGYIGLDNSERDYYGFIHTTLAKEGWKKLNFFGPGPYVKHEFWQTTFWKKP